MSNYLQAKVLAYLLGDTSYSPPATIYARSAGPRAATATGCASSRSARDRHCSSVVVGSWATVTALTRRSPWASSVGRYSATR
jgi:hypothetical protein